MVPTLEFFNPWEFECKCGCGLGVEQMDAVFLRRLDRARKLAGVPFHLTSAIRCTKHNELEGGRPTSSHLTGFAVDIAVVSSASRYEIRDALISVGFTRFGTGKAFLHVDSDPDKPNRVEWVY